MRHNLTMLSATPVFNRGTGLGNKLFPWARCVIFCRENDLKILPANWFQIRQGAFLKGGIDYSRSFRKILLWDNFENDGFPTRIKRKFLLTKYPDINEPTDFWKKQNNLEKEGIIQFKGDKNFFLNLHNHRLTISQEIEKITLQKHLVFVDKLNIPPVILNIRRGKDFNEAKKIEEYYNKGGLRTPLEWFEKVLYSIRKIVGEPIPAGIVSDGTATDLAPLLKLKNTTLIQTPAAITDLLVLSQSKLLIGTGGSSFSAWGAFLSNAPTISVAGQSFEWFKIGKQFNDQLITTVDLEFQNPNLLESAVKQANLISSIKEC